MMEVVLSSELKIPLLNSGERRDRISNIKDDKTGVAKSATKYQ
jgi:hypothetical protein